jgi:hypothetical protein
MALSGKYGQINIGKVGKDEPVFILRAQDTLAMYAIEMYELLAISHGCQIAKSVHQEVERFKNWNSPKKMPD